MPATCVLVRISGKTEVQMAQTVTKAIRVDMIHAMRSALVRFTEHSNMNNRTFFSFVLEHELKQLGIEFKFTPTKRGFSHSSKEGAGRGAYHPDDVNHPRAGKVNVGVSMPKDEYEKAIRLIQSRRPNDSAQHIMETATYKFLFELDRKYGLLTVPEKFSYIAFKLGRHENLSPLFSKAYLSEQAEIDYDYIISNIDDDPIAATKYFIEKMVKIGDYLENSDFQDK